MATSTTRCQAHSPHSRSGPALPSLSHQMPCQGLQAETDLPHVSRHRAGHCQHTQKILADWQIFPLLSQARTAENTPSPGATEQGIPARGSTTGGCSVDQAPGPQILPRFPGSEFLPGKPGWDPGFSTTMATYQPSSPSPQCPEP